MLENPTMFLIVSEEKGTFLGEGKWTKAGGENPEQFPAFNEQYARRVIALNGMTENPDEAKQKVLVKLVPVVPDKPGYRVTKAAMTAQGITAHGRSKEPQEGSPQPVGQPAAVEEKPSRRKA